MPRARRIGDASGSPFAVMLILSVSKVEASNREPP
jgi:hypothetical protein